MKIPSDKLEELKKAIADYIMEVKQKDKGTLQCDWFLSSDNTECEIREAYESSEALLARESNLGETIAIIFRTIGKPYSITIYGDPSHEVLENAKTAELNVNVYSLLIGL